MITGAHVIIYSENADEDRRFLQETLRLPSLDVGGGWLIFALPPSEVAVHPSEGGGPQQELFFTCDDITATVDELVARGASVRREVSDEGWGLLTSMRLPGGMEISLYQPRHPTARDIPTS